MVAEVAEDGQAGEPDPRIREKGLSGPAQGVEQTLDSDQHRQARLSVRAREEGAEEGEGAGGVLV
eukprot:CAMPEP_0114143284 /NCGR_PEP_ID=MMETSP0043_2-20121206/18903_1 /TAXON_ID=464988 /ORGANISM="Hemiselmis andersenii, Strain CCMP644" /LENGTH=64 /DNA_ID=CAMNT_0001237569 /DNA_START=159 /DNA_END=353 /DNA_ORIENTATION=-